MPLYFAYGSNMDVAAMKVRCPAARPIGPARLLRHRFLINGDGYATVVRDPRATVHGLLWDLALSDVGPLDRYEAIDRGLYVKVLQPVMTGQGPRRALVYVGRSAVPGVAKPGYLEAVVEAARAAGLPADYVAGLMPGKAGEAAPAPSFRAIGRKDR